MPCRNRSEFSNKIYMAGGIMIVRQLANSIVLSARSSALQKVTETVLAPLYMATVRQASQLASSASVVAERGGGGVHYPG